MLCITTGVSMRPLMLQWLFWSKEKLVFTTKDLRLRLLLKVMVFRTLKWPSAWITHLKNIWHWLQLFLLIIPNPTYHPLACCVFYNRKSVDSILSWSKINKKKKIQCYGTLMSVAQAFNNTRHFSWYFEVSVTKILW